MKKVIVLVCLSALLAGCAGRTANPVSTRQVGDKELPCEELEVELEILDKKSKKLMAEQSGKTGTNVALGLAGLFIWPIWFAMDLSDAERQEAEALRDRYDHLNRVARKQDCDFL